ncbi:hypothetical protein [Haloarcula montana]|uniref:hypothetical protein n=1 Tax=Haloarcula montana TaxID=3111776 RepID=UPI002D782CF0|nr:hypothetical protein [Haloarcula sp. GH36]
MTGFKSGASDDDPLNDDDTSADDSQPSPKDTGTQQSQEPELSGGSEHRQQTNLPWIYRRNSITDGRAKTVQLHLQDSTLDREQTARSEISIEETVNKADLREAAYLVGLQHLDEVAGTLREWGYDAQ